MSVSAAEMVDILAEVPKNLVGIFADWETLDEELKEHYAEELRWVLRLAQEKVREESTASAVRFRHAQVWAELWGLRSEIQRCMGFDLREVLGR